MALLDFASAQTMAQLWETIYQQNVPEDVCLQIQDHDTPYELTYRELNAKIQCLSAYLIAKGLKKGDRVLLLAGNHPLYLAFDFATLRAGGIVVTPPKKFTSAQLRSLLSYTSPKFIFLATYADYRRYAAFLDDLKGTELLCQTDHLDELRETDRVITLDSAIEQGKTFWRTLTDTIQSIRETLMPDDPATLFVDTETKQLRAVVHTHSSLLAQMRALAASFSDLSRNDTILSVLSPSMPLQRVAGMYLPLAMGLKPIHLQVVRNLPQALKKFRPKYVLATPLLLTALLRRWRDELGLAEKKFAANWEVAVKYHQLRHTGGKPGIVLRMKYRAAKRTLFKPLANRFMPGTRRIFCFGVGLQPKLEYFFLSTDVPLVPGFGFLETAGPIAVSDLHAPKLGAVGKTLEAVHINALQNGGELVVDGPMLSLGYWPDTPLQTPFATGVRAKTHNGLLYLE